MGGLHDDQIGDARADRPAVAGRLDRCGPRAGPGLHEGMTVLAFAPGNTAPAVLAQIEADAGQPGVAIEKVPREAQAERLGLADRLLRRQRVHRILHGVGREHGAVVAAGVRRVVVPLERDRDREIAQVVAIRPPQHLDQPHPGLAVGRLSDHAELRTRQPR
jgi:hypothetical protein